MAGLITALSTAHLIFKTVQDNEGKSKGETAAAIYAAMSSKKAGLVKTDGSITRLISPYIVEPVIIATHNTRAIDVIDKILEVNTDIFSSFYMQAFQVLRLNDIKASTVVTLLGTDADTSAIGTIKGLAIPYALKKANEERDYLSDLLLNENITLGTEDSNIIRGIEFDKREMKDTPLSMVLQRNLEIGIQADSTNRDGSVTKNTIMMPISVRTTVLFVKTENVLTMLAPNTDSKRFGYRLDEYRAGVISLADLIFATDLIKQYKDNKLNDEQHLLNLLNSRTLSANTKLLTHDTIGFEKSYNMLVVTSDDKVLIDKQLNGDFNNEKYKQKLLEATNAMSVTVIDQDHERANIYTRDIRGTSDISFRSLKRRKDSGVDLSELMKAMMAGRPPVF